MAQRDGVEPLPVSLAQLRCCRPTMSRMVPEQSYYRWRREYGGLKVGHTKRMNDLEKENACL